MPTQDTDAGDLIPGAQYDLRVSTLRKKARRVTARFVGRIQRRPSTLLTDEEWERYSA